MPSGPSRPWSGCAPASRTRWRCGSRRSAASQEPGAAPTTTGRSAHDVALDFVAHVRGAPATDAESELLREALECCSEDPDLVAARDAVVCR